MLCQTSTGRIMVWFGNLNIQVQRRLQKLVDVVWSITGTDLTTTEGIYRLCRIKTATKLNSSMTHIILVTLSSRCYHREECVGA